MGKLRLIHCCIVCFALVLSPTTSTLAYEAAPGCRAADFAGYDIVSKDTVRLSDYAGQWVLVEFWASWCGPCRRELGSFTKHIKPLVDSGKLAIVTVSLDEPASLPELKKLIKQYNLDYPVLYDGGDFDSVPAEEWGIHSVPSTFLINPAGVIVTNSLRGDELAPKLDYYIGHSRPAYSVSGFHVVDESGNLAVIAHATSPDHQPITVELIAYVDTLIWDPADPNLEITEEKRNIPPIKESQTITFDEFGDATCAFEFKPTEVWHSFIYILKCMAAGTEGLSTDGDGFWIDTDYEQILFIPLRRTDDCLYYIPPPDDKLRSYEVIRE